MKRAIVLICFLLWASVALADTEFSRRKNQATRIPVTFRNSSTGALITTGTVACKCKTWTDAASPADMTTACSTAAAVQVGTTGVWFEPLTAAEVNADFAAVLCTNDATNAMPFVATINTRYGAQDNTTVALANCTQWNSAAVATPTNAGYPLCDIHSGTGTNQLQVAGGLVGIAASGIPYNAAAARGTAQSVTAGPPSTLVMAASEAFADNELRYNTMVTVVSATAGAGQSSCICGNTGSSDTLTLCDPWATLPTGTITYLLRSAPNCVALRPTTIGNRLDVAATGEAGIDLSNTKAGTDWFTATGLATSAVNEIVDQVWDELQSDHATSGTMGAGQSSSGSSGASTFRAW